MRPMPMRPMDGIRVLDLSRVLAGPFAGRLLADLGADVVKVEPPPGDMTRWFGHRVADQGGYFVQQNAGKRGLCVDLGVPGAADVVRHLAGAADVVIENFRPGVLAAHGLDWAALAADHPSLVMLSITGFGQDGPEADRAAYAGIVHAESGYLARQSAVTGARVEETQLSVADLLAGLHGLVAVLAALRVRDATGVGQHIDVAMLDSFLVGDDYIHLTLDGAPAERGSGEIWETSEGPIIIIGGFKWVWIKAREELGVEDPTPPGASLEEKIACRRRAFAEYLAGFARRDDLTAALDKANLAWGVVRSMEDALASPTLAHRRSIVEVPGPDGGTRRVVDSPYRFSASPSGVRGGAPALGEHNQAVLGEWLGLGADDVAALTDRGVLVDRPPDPVQP